MHIGIGVRVELSKEAYAEMVRALEAEDRWLLPVQLRGEEPRYGLGFYTRKGDLVTFMPRKEE